MRRADDTPYGWHADAMNLAWKADRDIAEAKRRARTKLTRAAWLEIGAAHDAGAVPCPAVILWRSAGWLCVQAGLHTEAIACVQRGLRLDPTEALLTQLGDVLSAAHEGLVAEGAAARQRYAP